MATDTNRRIKGEGSFLELKNGSIRYKIIVDGVPYVREGKTKKEAKDKVDKLLKQSNISNVEFSKISYTEFVTDYWIPFKQKKNRPQSVSRIEEVLNLYILPDIGTVLLPKITPAMINQIMQTVTDDKKLSWSSCIKVYDVLNGSLRWAVEKQAIKYNPVSKDDKPIKEKFVKSEADKPSIKKLIFTDNERNRLIETCRAVYKTGKRIYKNGDMFIFQLYTGLRIGELLALRWEDINFNTENMPVMCVTRTITKYKQGGIWVHEVRPQVKTKGYGRHIPLNEKAMGALPVRCKSGHIWGVDGNPYKHRDIDTMFKRICTNAKVEWINNHAMHRCRHDFASRLIAKGYDVKTLSVILGHASVQITLDVYVELFDEHKAMAMLSLDLD